MQWLPSPKGSYWLYLFEQLDPSTQSCQSPCRGGQPDGLNCHCQTRLGGIAWSCRRHLVEESGNTELCSCIGHWADNRWGRKCRNMLLARKVTHCQTGYYLDRSKQKARNKQIGCRECWIHRHYRWCNGYRSTLWKLVKTGNYQDSKMKLEAANNQRESWR